MDKNQSKTHSFCPSSLQLLVQGFLWYFSKVSGGIKIWTHWMVKVGIYIDEMQV